MEFCEHVRYVGARRPRHTMREVVIAVLNRSNNVRTGLVSVPPTMNVRGAMNCATTSGRHTECAYYFASGLEVLGAFEVCRGPEYPTYNGGQQLLFYFYVSPGRC